MIAKLVGSRMPLLLLIPLVGCGGGGGTTPPPPDDDTNDPPTARITLQTPTGGAGRLIFGTLTAKVAIADSSDPEGTPLGFSLDWGDGSERVTGTLIETLEPPLPHSHTYATAGTYLVALTVHDDNPSGGIHTATTEVEVLPNAAPDPCFTANRTISANRIVGKSSLTLELNGECSTDSDTNVASLGRWDVDFGNGVVLNDIALADLDAHPQNYGIGNYTIVATLRDGEGQETVENLTVDVVVNEAPEWNAAFTPPLVGDSITLELPSNVLTVDTTNAIDPDNNLAFEGTLAVNWDDGSPVETVSPAHQVLQHTYPSITGTYFPTFQINDGDGGSDTFQTEVDVFTVIPPTACAVTTPAAVGGTISGSVPFNVNFDFRCSSDGDSDLSVDGLISVEFGDGVRLIDVDFGDFEQFTKLWTVPGTYTVDAVVTDEQGLESAHLTWQVIATP